MAAFWNPAGARRPTAVKWGQVLLQTLAPVGSPPTAATIEIMIRKRRKTLVVCPCCHDSIHNRQPNAEAA
jgi:hypothetical protein